MKDSYRNCWIEQGMGPAKGRARCVGMTSQRPQAIFEINCKTKAWLQLAGGLLPFSLSSLGPPCLDEFGYHVSSCTSFLSNVLFLSQDSTTLHFIAKSPPLWSGTASQSCFAFHDTDCCRSPSQVACKMSPV
ncbi:hypothetical protein HJG60_010210 [Phyllostomus discolor]|uniref:Uncharacterized protein n=1 Tax=Phyllostomus discolor TaxID=89673 RepID=A0A834EK51_9CHIR|nr:hypothetical protein HJG60_010210 [Phyllostomus discolor]